MLRFRNTCSSVSAGSRRSAGSGEARSGLISISDTARCVRRKLCRGIHRNGPGSRTTCRRGKSMQIQVWQANGLNSHFDQQARPSNACNPFATRFGLRCNPFATQRPPNRPKHEQTRSPKPPVLGPIRPSSLGFAGSKPIGAPRFELGTSPTRTVRATRLRHAPMRSAVSHTARRLGGLLPAVGRGSRRHAGHPLPRGRKSLRTLCPEGPDRD